MRTLDAPFLPATAEALARWLDKVVSERNFGVVPPTPATEAGSDRALIDACQHLVRAFSHEFERYATIIADADAAITRNAEQVRRALGDTKSYNNLIEHASATLERSRAGSARVASQTEALEHEAMVARDASHGAVVEVRSGGIDPLTESIRAVEGASSRLQSTAGGLTIFVDGVQRISRQAALLSTNALIEAAHLGDAGKGFGIVASEVRKLSESTKQSVQDVGLIAKSLNEATSRVVGVTGEAYKAVRKLGADTAAIRTGVERIDGLVVSFVEPVESIAAIAAQQQAALPALVENVEHVAQLAVATARAAEESSAIDLERMFAAARALIGSYRLHSGGMSLAPVQTGGSTLVEAIVRTAGGETDAITTLGTEHADPSARTIADAVARFATTLAAQEREILQAIMRVALAVARNSFVWKSIAGNLDRLKLSLEASSRALLESRDATTSLSRASQTMQRLADDLRREIDKPAAALASSVASLERVRENVAQVSDVVAEVTAALGRAGEILELVDDISAETTLLALNAAIEAAHAGTAGLGFSVIAEEIRKLADRTHLATRDVNVVIAEISESGDAIRKGTDASTERTHEVEFRAREVESVVDALLAVLASAVDRTQELASLADEQVIGFDALLQEIASTAHAIDASAAAATDTRRLELANIGRRAHELAARRTLEIFAEQVRYWGSALATEVEEVVDTLVDSGAMSIDAFKDTAYVEIDGERVNDLSRLFNVSRVPRSGFDPPKFETRYDRAIENELGAIVDRYTAKDAVIQAIFIVDLNGFCIAHFKGGRQDWSGIYETDLVGNRVKRFFEDPLSLRCARVGLGDAADELSARAPYADFVGAGCTMGRPRGARPWAIFAYPRDTGQVYNDLSVAIFVKDQRFGTARIIYDPDTL